MKKKGSYNKFYRKERINSLQGNTVDSRYSEILGTHKFFRYIRISLYQKLGSPPLMTVENAPTVRCMLFTSCTLIIRVLHAGFSRGGPPPVLSLPPRFLFAAPLKNSPPLNIF